MKFLLKICFINSLIILLLIGCAGSLKDVGPINVGNSNLTNDEQGELLSEMMIENYGFDIPHKYTYYNCPGKRSCDVKLAMNFDIKNNELITKDVSYCSLPDVKKASECLTGDNYSDYVKFFNKKMEIKKNLAKKFPEYQNEYSNVKMKITNWLNNAKNKDCKFAFKYQIPLNDEILNNMIKTVQCLKNEEIENSSPIKIFMEYKQSLKNLDDFLNNYSIARSNYSKKLEYGHYQLVGELSNNNYIELTSRDLDKIILLEQKVLGYNLTPIEFIIKDKNIIAKFFRGHESFRVEITNLTNDIIDIDSLAYYHDSMVYDDFSLYTNKSVPPHSTKNVGTIKIYEFEHYHFFIKSMEHEEMFGGAIGYTTKNIKNTLYKKEKIKIGDYEKNAIEFAK